MTRSEWRDLTTGSIWKKLLHFMIPLMMASLVQQMYNMVDLMFAGNLLDNVSSAAIGSGSSMIFTITAFFTGLSIGAGVVIAQAVGENDEKRIQKLVHTTMGMGMAMGIAVTVLGEAIIPFYLRTMQLPGEILGDSLIYLRIYFISTCPMILFNMAAAVIRASGNSSVPMFIQIAGGIANIVLDWLFLMAFRGVGSIAAASVVSQMIPLLLSVRYMCHMEGILKLDIKKIRIDRRLSGEILRMGIPSGIQAMAMSFSNLVIQYFINGLGINAISAFAAYYKIELFVYYPITAIGQAVTTFTGQNAGAGKKERIRRGFFTGLVLGLIVTIGISGVILLLTPVPYRLFNTDRDVILLAGKIGMMVFPFYWIDVFFEIEADIIRGVGKAMAPMLVVLFGICLLRVLLLPVFRMLWNDYRGIAVLYPITWSVCALVLGFYYIGNIRKRYLV